MDTQKQIRGLIRRNRHLQKIHSEALQKAKEKHASQLNDYGNSCDFTEAFLKQSLEECRATNQKLNNTKITLIKSVHLNLFLLGVCSMQLAWFLKELL